jgi:hypothetical protein
MKMEKYIAMAGDLPVIFPMLEMAEERSQYHRRYIACLQSEAIL